MSSKHFLSAHLLGSVLSGTRLVAGFVRIKYIALFLGTVGVGWLAQGNQLNLLCTTLGSLSMAVGIINRLTSKNPSDTPAKKQKLLSTAFTVQLVLSLSMLLFALLAGDEISKLVFGVSGEGRKCLAVLGGLPFTVLAGGYMEGILFGLNRYDYYVRAAILSTTLSLATFIPLVRYGGINGAFWAICANGVFLFASYAYYVAKLMPLRKVFRLGFDKEELRTLLRFSAVMLITAAAGYGSNILIRRQILTTLGAASNGIAQVPLAITAYYTPFLTNGLWGRLHPQVSASGDVPEARDELALVLRFITLFTSGIVVTMLLLQEFLIKFTYSSAFLGALPLMPIQFAGDFFYFIAFTISVYFLGAARLRVYLAGWMVYYAAQTSGAMLLLPSLGLRAFPFAYFLSSALLAAAAMLWFVRRAQGRSSARTAAVIVACFCAVAAQSFLSERRYGYTAKIWAPLVMLGLMAYAWRSREPARGVPA